MQNQATKKKNTNIDDETKLRDSKNISSRNNMKRPRLSNLKLWKTSPT